MQSCSIVGPPRSSGASVVSSSNSIFDNQENRVPKRSKSVHVYGYTDGDSPIPVPVKRKPLSFKSSNSKAASVSEFRSTLAQSNAVNCQGDEPFNERISTRNGSDYFVSQTEIFHEVAGIEPSDTVDDSESEPEVLSSSSAHTSQKSASGVSSDRAPFSEALVNTTVDTSFAEPDVRCTAQPGTGNFCAQDYAQASDSTPECIIYPSSDHTAISEYHSEKTGFQHAPSTPQFLENVEHRSYRCESSATVYDELYPRSFQSIEEEYPPQEGSLIPMSVVLTENDPTADLQGKCLQFEEYVSSTRAVKLEKHRSKANVSYADERDELADIPGISTNIAYHTSLHDNSDTSSHETSPEAPNLLDHNMAPVDMLASDTVDLLKLGRSLASHKNHQDAKRQFFVTLPISSSLNHSRSSSTSVDTMNTVNEISRRGNAFKSASEPPVLNTHAPEIMMTSVLADCCEPLLAPQSSNRGSVLSHGVLKINPRKSLREICSVTSSASQARRVGLSKRRRIDPLHRR